MLNWSLLISVCVCVCVWTHCSCIAGTSEQRLGLFLLFGIRYGDQKKRIITLWGL